MALGMIALVQPALAGTGNDAADRLVRILRWVCWLVLFAGVYQLAARFPWEEALSFMT
ncbi:hypothetical protein [Pseudonocardia ailaonensis]|uniref:hypothetical protein n=1 Tax=Pseudonocardia ailaonensis TaxID=367279 RepID=UPI0031D55845